jgi:hypothetical protein
VRVSGYLIGGKADARPVGEGLRGDLVRMKGVGVGIIETGYGLRRTVGVDQGGEPFELIDVLI